MPETNNELIEEALTEPTLGPASDRDAAQYWANLARKLADRLAAAGARAAEAEAVIAEARKAGDCGSGNGWDTVIKMNSVLEDTPSAVLARVKAEAAAVAIEEAAEMIRGIGLAGTNLEWAHWLDSRSRLLYRAGAEQ